MYEDLLKYYPGFPIEGVNFVDIIPLMQDKETFKSLIKDLGKLIGSPNVAAPEARGFLFAAPMLVSCDNVVNVIPMRKKGKLPYTEGDLVGVDITKEYGKDKIFFRLSDVAAGVPEGDTFNVTFFDDILATGGTAKATWKLVNQFHPKKIYMNFIIEITDEGLHGRDLFKGLVDVTTLMVV